MMGSIDGHLQTVHFTHITIVSREQAKVPFPWSAFLSQPIFDPKQKLILNPHKFQQIYHARLLESCLRRFHPNNYQ
jgi:hypothetical protein